MICHNVWATKNGLHYYKVYATMIMMFIPKFLSSFPQPQETIHGLCTQTKTKKHDFKGNLINCWDFIVSLKIMFNNVTWEKWTKNELDPMDDGYKSLCLYITKRWMPGNVGYVYEHGGGWNWWWKSFFFYIDDGRLLLHTNKRKMIRNESMKILKRKKNQIILGKTYMSSFICWSWNMY